MEVTTEFDIDLSIKEATPNQYQKSRLSRTKTEIKIINSINRNYPKTIQVFPKTYKLGSNRYGDQPRFDSF